MSASQGASCATGRATSASVVSSPQTGVQGQVSQQQPTYTGFSNAVIFKPPDSASASDGKVKGNAMDKQNVSSARLTRTISAKGRGAASTGALSTPYVAAPLPSPTTLVLHPATATTEAADQRHVLATSSFYPSAPVPPQELYESPPRAITVRAVPFLTLSTVMHTQHYTVTPFVRNDANAGVYNTRRPPRHERVTGGGSGKVMPAGGAPAQRGPSSRTGGCRPSSQSSALRVSRTAAGNFATILAESEALAKNAGILSMASEQEKEGENETTCEQQQQQQRQQNRTQYPQVVLIPGTTHSPNKSAAPPFASQALLPNSTRGTTASSAKPPLSSAAGTCRAPYNTHTNSRVILEQFTTPAMPISGHRWRFLTRNALSDSRPTSGVSSLNTPLENGKRPPSSGVPSPLRSTVAAMRSGEETAATSTATSTARTSLSSPNKLTRSLVKNASAHDLAALSAPVEVPEFMTHALERAAATWTEDGELRCGPRPVSHNRSHQQQQQQQQLVNEISSADGAGLAWDPRSPSNVTHNHNGDDSDASRKVVASTAPERQEKSTLPHLVRSALAVKPSAPATHPCTAAPIARFIANTCADKDTNAPPTTTAAHRQKKNKKTAAARARDGSPVRVLADAYDEQHAQRMWVSASIESPFPIAPETSRATIPPQVGSYLIPRGPLARSNTAPTSAETGDNGSSIARGEGMYWAEGSSPPHVPLAGSKMEEEVERRAARLVFRHDKAATDPHVVLQKNQVAREAWVAGLLHEYRPLKLRDPEAAAAISPRRREGAACAQEVNDDEEDEMPAEYIELIADAREQAASGGLRVTPVRQLEASVGNFIVMPKNVIDSIASPLRQAAAASSTGIVSPTQSARKARNVSAYFTPGLSDVEAVKSSVLLSPKAAATRDRHDLCHGEHIISEEEEEQEELWCDPAKAAAARARERNRTLSQSHYKYLLRDAAAAQQQQQQQRGPLTVSSSASFLQTPSAHPTAPFFSAFAANCNFEDEKVNNISMPVLSGEVNEVEGAVGEESHYPLDRTLVCHTGGQEAAVRVQRQQQRRQSLEDKEELISFAASSGADRARLVAVANQMSADSRRHVAALSSRFDELLLDAADAQQLRGVARERVLKLGTAFQEREFHEHHSRRHPLSDAVISPHDKWWANNIEARRRTKSGAGGGGGKHVEKRVRRANPTMNAHSPRREGDHHNNDHCGSHYQAGDSVFPISGAWVRQKTDKESTQEFMKKLKTPPGAVGMCTVTRTFQQRSPPRKHKGATPHHNTPPFSTSHNAVPTHMLRTEKPSSVAFTVSSVGSTRSPSRYLSMSVAPLAAAAGAKRDSIKTKTIHAVPESVPIEHPDVLARLTDTYKMNPEMHALLEAQADAEREVEDLELAAARSLRDLLELSEESTSSSSSLSLTSATHSVSVATRAP